MTNHSPVLESRYDGFEDALELWRDMFEDASREIDLLHLHDLSLDGTSPCLALHRAIHQRGRRPLAITTA